MLETNAIITIILGFIVLFAGIAGQDKLLRIDEHRGIKISIKTITVFLFLWIVAILVRDSYDIFFYRAAYNDRVSHGKEVLFDLVQFSLHDNGLSFNGFILIWNTIVILLLFFGIRRYTGVVSAVAALMIMEPYSLYITQMRNSMVSVILLCAFPLLFSGRKQDRILYAIVVFLCAQIHIIAYAYLVFLLLSRSEEREYPLKYFIAIAISTAVVMAMSVLPIGVVTGVISKLPLPGSITGRLISYIGSEKTPIKAVMYLIIKHIYLYWLTDRACSLLQDRYRNDEETRKKYSVIKEMNTMMLLFLPIALLNASFERIFNCFIVIQYAMVFNVRRERTGLFFQHTEISMQFLLLAAMGIFLAISVHSNPEDLTRILNSIGATV